MRYKKIKIFFITAPEFSACYSSCIKPEEVKPVVEEGDKNRRICRARLSCQSRHSFMEPNPKLSSPTRRTKTTNSDFSSCWWKAWRCLHPFSSPADGFTRNRISSSWSPRWSTTGPRFLTTARRSEKSTLTSSSILARTFSNRGKWCPERGSSFFFCSSFSASTTWSGCSRADMTTTEANFWRVP